MTIRIVSATNSGPDYTCGVWSLHNPVTVRIIPVEPPQSSRSPDYICGASTIQSQSGLYLWSLHNPVAVLFVVVVHVTELGVAAYRGQSYHLLNLIKFC